MNVEPHRHCLDLACDPATAFHAYVARIGEWWPAGYTADAETLETVTIEPVVGGRVYERHQDGSEIDWGRVTVLRPDEEVAYTSTLAQSQAHPSEIRVLVTPDGAGCQVAFEHGGWDEANLADRAKFQDWPMILARFAALADG